jgi:hypothetical protein
MRLTAEQEALTAFPLEKSIFTQLCRYRQNNRRDSPPQKDIHGTPGRNYLILLPQRVMGTALRRELEKSEGYNPSRVALTTMNTIARRMVDLFWPLISERAGFLRPYAPPQFLTLETSQFYMGKLVNPMLDAGRFSSVSIPRSRLYSQILDSINKSALVGFPIGEFASDCPAPDWQPGAAERLS